MNYLASTRRTAVQLSKVGRLFSSRTSALSFLLKEKINFKEQDISISNALARPEDQRLVTRYSTLSAAGTAAAGVAAAAMLFVLDTGCEVMPHPSKVHKGGEDAYFITKDGRVIGVADGVSAWSQYGIDPKEFSQRLMQECQAAANTGLTDPTTILEKGYSRVRKITGSSTACIGVLNGDTFDAVNVGDSGFMVVREGKAVFRTKEQQHFFNCPFQLGTDSNDTPKDGDVSHTKVKDGDLIIMGSDGLWDNVFDAEILQTVNNLVQTHGPQCGPQVIATALAKLAMDVGKSPTKFSPFAANAKQSGYAFNGGKLDDVTVLVARVKTPAPQSKL